MHYKVNSLYFKFQVDRSKNKKVTAILQRKTYPKSEVEKFKVKNIVAIYCER